MDDPSMEELVLLYLSSIDARGDVDYDASTHGIAEAVDLGENTLADRVELLSALSDLQQAGYIEEHKQSVEGLSKERNVYSLTEAGRDRAETLRSEAQSESITVRTDGGMQRVQLSGIGRYLDSDAPIVAALARSSDGTLVLDEDVEPIEEEEFVDRESELEWLQDRLELAAEGQPQTAMITGEPGVGKTTLVEELRTAVNDRGGTFLGGRCRRDVDQPYRSFFEAIEGLPEADANELRSLLSNRPGYDLRDQEALSAQRSELFASVAETLASLSVDGPLVLFFDDVQWMDPTTAALVGGIANRIEDAPVMLVGTCRPTTWSDEELIDRLDGKLTEESSRLDLERLDRVSTEDLIHRLLGTNAVPDEFVDDVYDLTAGNPLFVTESITRMLESGTVDPALGEYPESRQELHVPDAVEQTIASRFESIDDRTRELLAIGSLVGDTMPRDVLSAASNLDRPSFLDSVGILLGGGVWSMSDDRETFYFESGVVRETLRDQLEEKRRETLHCRIAEAYETVQDEIEAGPATIAYHYHRAGAHEEALEAYLDAAAEAESVSAHESAIQSYDRALEVARELDDDATTVPILERMGDAHTILGEYGDARRRFQYVLERSDDPVTVQRMHRKIAETYEKQGQYDDLLDHVDRGLDRTGRADDRTEVPALLSTRASALGMTGDKDRALEAANRAADVATETGDELARARALRVAGKIHRQHGEIDAAREVLESAVDVVRETDDRQELGSVLKELGTTRLRDNDYDGALSTYEECYDIYEEIGDSHGMASIHNNKGVIYHYHEDLDRAREQYERGIEIAERIGDEQGMVKFYTNLGYVETTAGNFEDALEWSHEAARLAEVIGDRNGIISAHEIDAEVAFYRGNLDRSLEQAQQALRIAEEIDDKNRKTGTLYLLGRTRMAVGDLDSAIETFESGIEIGDEHGITQKAALNRYGSIRAYLLAGREEDAAEQMDRIEDLKMVSWESVPARITYHRFQGNYEEVESLIEETLEHAEETDQAPLVGRLAYERAKLAVERGDPDAEDAIEDALDTVSNADLDLFVDWIGDLREDLD